MAYNPRDFYFKQAKKQNFAARSIFKLEEINKRFHLIKPGYTVLDLGCAPGSWAQYASPIIGRSGRLIGVDLQKVSITLPNATFIQGDALSTNSIDQIIQENNIKDFDLVMSDMAPKTTGIRITDQQRSYELSLKALNVAIQYLKPSGHFIVKLFQSDEFDAFTQQVKLHFKKMELLRPKSTRKESFEIFIIGVNKK